MGFAERNGFAEVKSIQIDDIDAGLRNRLYNLINENCTKSNYFNEELSFIMDKLGYRNNENVIMNWNVISNLLVKKDSDTPWYMPYEIIELFLKRNKDVATSVAIKNAVRRVIILAVSAGGLKICPKH